VPAALSSAHIGASIRENNMLDSLMKSLDNPPSNSSMHPHLIASGLGLASRQELSGLCALLEAVSLIDVAIGAGADVIKRVGLEIDGAEARMKSIAEKIQNSDETDDALRHRLWHALGNALGTRNQLPLSERRVAEEAAALGVMASRVLSAGLHAQEEAKRRQDAGRDQYMKRFEDQIQQIYKDPTSLWRSKPPLAFPEIVSRELASMLDTLKTDDNRVGFDPDIAKAMQKGGQQAWAGIAAAGGWVGMATAVNAAGFAPYILAAQASAFIPFVGGPAAVSFLAVMANPVTIVAGLLALGGLGGKTLNKTIKSQVSARIVVLLALRGLADPNDGLGCATTAFRHLCASGSRKPGHLGSTEWSKLRSRATRVETEIGRGMPDAPRREPVKWGAAPEIKHQNTNSKDTMAVIGLTAAEMLYHAASIDPRVLEAADFWRIADIANQLEFATHAMEFAVRGSDIALRGFTAEQLVLGNLIAQGHHVTLPDSSNNPGFDLIVDGQEVQVKCGEGLSLLSEHFEKYPDTPVIANAELVAKVSDEPWADMVTALDGFELSTVREITESSVAAGIELASMDALAAAIGVGAIRGTVAVLTGEISADDLPAWLVVDAALRGALVTVGGKAGAIIGLVAIGPAGALVLGPIMGAMALFGMGGAKALVDSKINKKWHDEMLAEAEALRATSQRSLKARIALLVGRRDNVFRPSAKLPGDLATWLDRRAADDAIAASEDLLDLDASPRTLIEAMCLDIVAARANPASPDVLRARSLLQKKLSSKPGPLDGALNQVDVLWKRSRLFAKFEKK